MKQNPIGIFDSGMGGLSIAYAIKQLLPHETLFYVADLQHFPYGDKTVAQIEAYSLRITNWLLAQGCKMIVIACNTAASSAMDKISQYAAGKAIVVDVILPMVEHIAQHYVGKKVGLIATQRTVDSQIYSYSLSALTANIELHSVATPLLVTHIENHYAQDIDCHELLATYLSNPRLQELDALILACTHYAFIKEQICNYYQHQLKIIDSQELVAALVKKILQKSNLLNDLAISKSKVQQKFFTTRESLRFTKTIDKFFAIEAKFLML